MYMHNSNCLHIIRMYRSMHQSVPAPIVPATTAQPEITTR